MSWARRLRAGWWRLGFGALVGRYARPLVVAGRLPAPGDPPRLYVANHASHADTAVLLATLGPRLRGRLVVAAADDYFFSTRWRALASRALVGALPFPRSGPVGLQRVQAALADGDSVLLYPQGTRDGGPFRCGVGRLAATGVEVVPIGLRGTGHLLPKGCHRPRPAPVTIRFGIPRTWTGSAPELAADIEAAVTALTLDIDDAATLGPRR